MARKKKTGQSQKFGPLLSLSPETKQSIAALFFIVIALILGLASIDKAGSAGEGLFSFLSTLFGWGYLLLPLVFLGIAVLLLTHKKERTLSGPIIVGSIIFFLSGLGFIDVLSYDAGGIIGRGVGYIDHWFGSLASGIILFFGMLIGGIIAFDTSVNSFSTFIKAIISFFSSSRAKDTSAEITPSTLNKKEETFIAAAQKDSTEEKEEKPQKEKKKEEPAPSVKEDEIFTPPSKIPHFSFENYTPPPINLLTSSAEKPAAGDLRAQSNIIKRTLESFGIPVDMGEINIGPKVTRFTLRPAEGIKLSRIIALNQDLALALSAHPIRIEAPIPGKPYVGIEVPNKKAAVVRLGNLISYPEFSSSGLLGFCLGRDVTGEPLFANIEKMPHLLIAGATGSGKSITLHSVLISLLYKNSPETLRFILIDPKRVELSAYNGLPHLIAPVVTEGKKSLAVFRWAISEMDRRYETLMKAGARDIQSFNKKAKEKLPYIVIVVDEMADLMASYGRDIENAIVRLAQMARATGIHLILSTQRPSVEVITGLIKANITARIALQVASQIDSRTILDTAGAEKLLGGGDLLFINAQLSKPKRLQGAFISEEEIQEVTSFIKKNNDLPDQDVHFGNGSSESTENVFESFEGSEEEDELIPEAMEVIQQAQKASASLLQRRLKVGYARAARLLDILENKGLIGPGDGSKPREVYMDSLDEKISEE